MATLTNLTAKQKKAIAKLYEMATRYKIKIDEINRQIAEPVISFEENLALREKLLMYKARCKKATDEINDISDEYKKYRDDLEKARFYIESAEKRKKLWGDETW